MGKNMTERKYDAQLGTSFMSSLVCGMQKFFTSTSGRRLIGLTMTPR